MAKRTKKAGLRAGAKIISRTRKKAGGGKKEAGLIEELKKPGRIKIDRESKKIILPDQEEKIERDKTLMMWAGVSFFMVLISAFWVLNIKSVFKGTKEARENPQKFEWEKITNEFDQTIEQIKEGLVELKQINVMDDISTTTKDNLNLNNLLPGSEDIGSSSPQEAELEGGGNLEELKDRLKELEEEIESKN